MKQFPPWLFLLVASFFEILWVVLLRYSSESSSRTLFIFALTFAVLSFIALSYAIKFIPLGLTYSIWTGTGILGTTVLGVLLFNDDLDYQHLIFILFLLIGVVGLMIKVNT